MSSSLSVHDGWAPYAGYTGVAHALCGAHIRELAGVTDRDPTATWATHLARCSSEPTAGPRRPAPPAPTGCPTPRPPRSPPATTATWTKPAPTTRR
jgi:hypothetical protein